MVRDRGFMVPLWIAAIAAPLGLILTFAHGGGLIHIAGLCLIGGAVLIGLIALAIWHRAGDMVYGLTDARVLVLRDGTMPKLDATRADRIAWIGRHPPARRHRRRGAHHRRWHPGRPASWCLAGSPTRRMSLAGWPPPTTSTRRIYCKAEVRWPAAKSPRRGGSKRRADSSPTRFPCAPRFALAVLSFFVAVSATGAAHAQVCSRDSTEPCIDWQVKNPLPSL